MEDDAQLSAMLSQDHASASGGGDGPQSAEDRSRSDTTTDGDYYNILLSGAADLRHVIKTAAKFHRSNLKKRGKKLRFFLHDQQPEVSARHLLFMQIICNKGLSARERAEIFLSLYGNALVRDRDSKYCSDQVGRIPHVVGGQSLKNDFGPAFWCICWEFSGSGDGIRIVLSVDCLVSELPPLHRNYLRRCRYRNYLQLVQPIPVLQFPQEALTVVFFHMLMKKDFVPSTSSPSSCVSSPSPSSTSPCVRPPTTQCSWCGIPRCQRTKISCFLLVPLQVAYLLSVVAENDKDEALTKLFDFSHLKYKERDFLEEVLHGWKEGVAFDMESLRDQRLRGSYVGLWIHGHI